MQVQEQPGLSNVECITSLSHNATARWTMSWPVRSGAVNKSAAQTVGGLILPPWLNPRMECRGGEVWGVGQGLHVLGGKGDGSTRTPRSGCAPHPVHVVLAVAGHIVIYHHVHVRNVEAPTGYIGGRQNAALPSLRNHPPNILPNQHH